MFKDIIGIIVEKCCHPDSKRPFSTESIKSALKNLHIGVKLDQPTKKQALEAIKELIKNYYITRTQMKIKVTVKSSNAEKSKEELVSYGAQVVNQDKDKDLFQMVCLIQPSAHRKIDSFIKNLPGGGTLEIVEQYVMNKETTDLENAGVVHLQLRDKPLDQASDDEEDDKKHGGNSKKAGKKGGKKKNGKKGGNKNDEDDDNSQSDDEDNKKEGEKAEHSEADKKPEETKMVDPLASNPNAKKCTSCNAYFETNADFKAHYKTEWHKFNTKRKTEKKDPMTENEYMEHMLDSDLAEKEKGKRKR